MCYCSGDPPEREVYQLNLSPRIHATAGLRISDQIVCAHSEMQMFWVPHGLGGQQTGPFFRGEGRVWKSAATSLQVSFSRQEAVQREIINSSQLCLSAVFEEIHGIDYNTTEQSGNT